MSQYAMLDQAKAATLSLRNSYGVTANGYAAAVAALDAFDEATIRPFKAFFTDTGNNPLYGLNLLQGDLFCRLIPEESNYNKVRTLLLDNLECAFEKLVNTAMQLCIARIETVAASMPNVSTEFLNNYSLPTINLSDILSEPNSKLSRAAKIVEQWLALGEAVLDKQAIMQCIFLLNTSKMYGCDSTVYDKLVEKNDIIAEYYSSNVASTVADIQEIKEAHPYESDDKIGNRINKKILEDLQVLSKCNAWYEELEGLFVKDS